MTTRPWRRVRSRPYRCDETGSAVRIIAIRQVSLPHYGILDAYANTELVGCEWGSIGDDEEGPRKGPGVSSVKYTEWSQGVGHTVNTWPSHIIVRPQFRDQLLRILDRRIQRIDRYIRR